MHLIRRSVFRSISSPSTSFFSKSRSINTSSHLIIRTKPQATVFPIFRRLASNDAESEGQSSIASNDSSTSESASTYASEEANHSKTDTVVDTTSDFAATTGFGRNNRNEYRPSSNYDDRRSAPPSTFGGQRVAGASNLRVTPSNGLYIGNLLFGISEADLRKEFGEYGEIKEVRIARDARNISKGFGYVTYSSVDAATLAIQARNQTTMEGRRIVVNYQIKDSRLPAPNNPSNTLFIGNLAFEMSDADLNKLFRDIQNVMDVRVAIDRRTGQPRGFAHADFTDVESAMKGLDYLQGKEFYGRILRVDFAGAPKKPDGARSLDSLREF